MVLTGFAGIFFSMFNIQNLTITLNDQPIIHDLSFTIAPGTIHALMGPNGSGKSTLAAALMGDPRYVVAAGSAQLLGVDLLSLSPDKRAQLGLFLAFQQPIALPGVRVFTFLHEMYNALHGTKIGPKEFTDILHAAFDVVCMDHGYAHRAVNEGFSGGEKKKLELVQLLLAQPKVVILDEIDSGLDIDALKLVATVIARLRDKNPQMVVIMITHYQRLLEYVAPDYVHLIMRGSLVRTGDTSLVQLIEHKGYDGII